MLVRFLVICFGFCLRRILGDDIWEGCTGDGFFVGDNRCLLTVVRYFSIGGDVFALGDSLSSCFYKADYEKSCTAYEAYKSDRYRNGNDT